MNNKKYYINKEKGTVTCFAQVGNKLLKDSRRYNLDPFMFPTEVISVARVRGGDNFESGIGKKVASDKTEKDYLNNLLNTPEEGLRDRFKVQKQCLSELESLIGRLYIKRVNLMNAIKDLTFVDEKYHVGVEIKVDKEAGVTIAEALNGANVSYGVEQTLCKFLPLPILLRFLETPQKAVARVHPEDTFDEKVGISVAVKKLQLKTTNSLIKKLEKMLDFERKQAYKMQQDIAKIEERRNTVLEQLSKH